jgi:FMN phosphatase YigB (HAD superfamily)
VDEIRGIIFDFGRVICDFDVRIFLRKAAPYSGRTPADLDALMPSTMEFATAYETGLISSEEFFAQLSAKVSLRMPREEFVRAYTDIFTPIETTFELIRQLKPRYKLGLLSNTSVLHFEKGIKPVAVFPLFDTVSLSYEVRSMKPDRRIYDDAIRKMGLPPGACVYIDDIAANVAAGEALGLRAIQYTTHGALVADLRRLGVAVPERTVN